MNSWVIPFGRSRGRPLAAFLLVTLLLSFFLGALPQAALAADPVTAITGDIGGAAYKIEKPDNWNGTLVLYSHGYVAPGSSNPARDVGDPLTGAYLLSQGYALAGSSYSATGWALQQAFNDQIALLDFFKSKYGQPKRTIAWGHSLGGIITAGLIQRNPERFDAALPMCGVLQGGIEAWNSGLDGVFALKTLVAPTSALQVVHITNPQNNFALAGQVVDSAQATPQGKARLALATALAGTPGWFDPASPEPAPTDYAAREQNQYLWIKNVDIAFFALLRAELEARAGGNPSSNTGLNYRQMFDNLPQANKEMVMALYSQAGLNLSDDLRTLDNAPKISADPAALDYMNKYISFNGQISIPVLTLHTSGDGLVLPQAENAYAKVVQKAGNQGLLRQIFVHRAGHCSFTPAETIVAFNRLVSRLNSGQWSNTSDVAALNNEAAALGPELNVLSGADNKVVPVASAYFSYTPAPMPRDFTPTTSTLPGTGAEDSPAQSVSFPETGYSLSGLLLSFWTGNGGLPIFGYPIDSERQQNGQVFQWLERNRLEKHPENQAPYNVLLGLLGTEALSRQGVDWHSLPTVSSAPEGCRYFPETQHSLCGDFLAYWQSHGLQIGDGHNFAASLALFGYPVSEPKLETNSSGDTVLTQWFERARFEFHPDNPEPYRVELGRLGAELFNIQK